jgi:hypothetical protein
MYHRGDRYSAEPARGDNRGAVTRFPVLLAVVALPGLLALGATPWAAHALTGLVAPRRWMWGVLAWTVVSTLAFTAWCEIRLHEEIAARSAGPLRQNGLFYVLGFVFWNGVLVLAANVVAGIVGLIARRRRGRR